MGVATYEADGRLNRMRGTASPSVPANYYISLHSADPAATGANEITSEGGYARIAVSTVGGSWAAPSTVSTNRVISNAAAVGPFGPASDDWVSVTHAGVFDALTAGNFIRGAALVVAKTALTDDEITFAIGDLIWREAIGT